MRVVFNCREGAVTPSRGNTWPMHPTWFWRRPNFVDVPANAEWAGYDDKEACCWLVHMRSIRTTKEKGKPPQNEVVPGL